MDGVDAHGGAEVVECKVTVGAVEAKDDAGARFGLIGSGGASRLCFLTGVAGLVGRKTFQMSKTVASEGEVETSLRTDGRISPSQDS